ncbi:MAG: nickel pincer cofactor biosynthesis protein LarC [Actinomycetota bacterium]
MTDRSSTVAWFHCGAGTAGDMTLAALVDAGADPLAVHDIIGGLRVDDYALTFERTQRSGVSATRALVAVHDHHPHQHRTRLDIDRLLTKSDLPTRVTERARKVFAVLADVEAAIHGVTPEEVEFHEVGSTDAIVDIVGVCAALEVLGVDSIVCGPISVGCGQITTAQGVLPNPAPAVTALCARRQVPVIGLDDPRELATPTGVALMVALADSFGTLPTLDVTAVGYGAGAADISGRANVVTVVLGTGRPASATPASGEPVRLLEANVDDVTGEVIAHTIAALLAAGAHDAWATPIVMKKGRPAYTVHALCDPSATERVSEVLIAETGTLGLRGAILDRWPQMRREIVVDMDGHDIRVKISNGRAKVEHDDAQRAALALARPLREVLAQAERLALD